MYFNFNKSCFYFLVVFMFSSITYAGNPIVVNSDYGSVQVSNHKVGVRSGSIRPYVFHFQPLDTKVPFVIVQSVEFQDGTSCTGDQCFSFSDRDREKARELYSKQHQASVSTIMSFDKPIHRIELRLSPFFRTENDTNSYYPNLVYVEDGVCDFDDEIVRGHISSGLGTPSGLIRAVWVTVYNGEITSHCGDYK